jgi:hypothetical protein
MRLNRLLVGLFFAATLAAQAFIQISDPQFGMFWKDVDSKSGEMSEWPIEHA